MKAAAEALWKKGLASAEDRRWLSARDAFAALVEQAPGHVPSWLHLSSVLSKMGRYRDARDAILAAASLAVDDPALCVAIMQRLAQFVEPAPLAALFERSSFALTANPGQLLQAAGLLAAIGAHDHALDCADRAAGLAPGNAAVFYLRGSILMFLGRADDAHASLRQSLRLDPRSAQGYWMLSRLGRPFSDADLAAMQRLQGQFALGSDGAVYIALALFAELDRRGEHDLAWRALSRKLTGHGPRKPYDAAQFRTFVSRIKDTCDRRFVDAGFPQPLPDPLLPDPIFIVGLHRSGTTLLEHMLAGHSQVRDAGETYLFTAQMRHAADYHCPEALDMTLLDRFQQMNFEGIGAGYARAMQWYAGDRPRVTDKLPQNYLNVGAIARAVPRARIVHMVRDPVSTCFSNLRTFFRGIAPYAYDQVQMADHFAAYHGLMAHWRSILPDRLTDVVYEDLVADPEGELRRVAVACGLAYEPAMLELSRRGGGRATPSAGQVRNGVRQDLGQAWRPYEAQLSPMIERLRSHGLL